MIAVKVICVGKLKEAFYQQACAEYEKRLKGFCRLEVVELPEDTRPGNLVREAEKIRQAIPQGSYTVALCIEGTFFGGDGRKHQTAGGPAAFHVAHDIPPSPGPGDAAGTAVPGLCH